MPRSARCLIPAKLSQSALHPVSPAPGLDRDLLRRLACPVDREPLEAEGDWLRCGAGHRYPVVEGVPVLLRPDRPETLWVARASWTAACAWAEGRDRSDPWFVGTLGLSESQREALARRLAAGGDGAVDLVISFMLGATSGYLYRGLVGSAASVPIPSLRLADGTGALLDIGCNWGRWTCAAARKGYGAVGIDPSLGAVLTGQRLARRLGLSCRFVCGDGRYLPFADASFAKVFSYSVLQHLGREDMEACLREAGRVLEPGGESLVQMASLLGVRSLYHRLRRRFVPPRDFDVRYWFPWQLKRFGRRAIGPSRLEVDGYFGLGIQPSDWRSLPFASRLILVASEALRRLARVLPPLTYLADSLYIRSRAKR